MCVCEDVSQSLRTLLEMAEWRDGTKVLESSAPHVLCVCDFILYGYVTAGFHVVLRCRGEPALPLTALRPPRQHQLHPAEEMRSADSFRSTPTPDVLIQRLQREKKSLTWHLVTRLFKMNFIIFLYSFYINFFVSSHWFVIRNVKYFNAPIFKGVPKKKRRFYLLCKVWI